MKKILEKAKKIRLIALDVDGVLTAGEFIILNSGEEVKIWNIKDRYAYALLKKTGLDIKLAWITARESDQVKIRAEEQKIDFLYQKQINKAQAFEDIAKKTGLNYDNMVFIGDDWIDIPVLRRAGLSICPNDSPEEVKRNSDYTSKYPGGKGVFREVVEIIAKAQNAYKKIIDEYES